jgi:uncharacterized protein (DUF983 family)
MFSQVQSASAVLRQGSASMPRNLLPGLSSCPECGKTRAITGPVLHVCEDCGVQHTVASRQ